MLPSYLCNSICCALLLQSNRSALVLFYFSTFRFFVFKKKKIGFGCGALHPSPPGFWLGGQSPLRPPPKRLSAAFDRGGQTGPPRSNAFFSAPLTTRAPPTTVRDDRPPADARPAVAFQETRFLETTFEIRFQEKQSTVCNWPANCNFSLFSKLPTN